MNRGMMRIGAACAMLLLVFTGCQKTPEQVNPPKCNDFNNRQTVTANYNDTTAADMANYFEGQNCKFHWQLSAVDACENAPLDISNKITVLADDTLDIKMGYMFEHTGEAHYINMKRSDPYIIYLGGVPYKVVDLTNTDHIFNKCTTCNGADPTPVNSFIELTFPSAGNSTADKAQVRQMVKFINMTLTYVYNLE